jgi:hypothetical protein
MPTILRQFPFFETPTTTLVSGGSVTVRPYQIDSGIAVYPEGTPAVPRLPLLGLRGLRRADLQLHVDCRKCRVDLHTPRPFWPF